MKAIDTFFQQMQQQTAVKQTHIYKHNYNNGVKGKDKDKHKGEEKQQLSQDHHFDCLTKDKQLSDHQLIASSVNLKVEDKDEFQNCQSSKTSKMTINKHNTQQLDDLIDTKTETTFKANKKIHNLDTYKKLDNIKVTFKKIQELDQQKQKQREAKNFIFRINKQKREFEGRLMLIKRKQQQRRSLQMRKHTLDLLQQKQMQRLKRRHQSQSRWENNCERLKRRQLLKSRRQSLNFKTISNNTNSSKIKLNRLIQNSEERQSHGSASLAHIQGNKYLKYSGRIRYKCKTQSAYYQDLNQSERKQIERIRQKINLLTFRLNNK